MQAQGTLEGHLPLQPQKLSQGECVPGNRLPAAASWGTHCERVDSGSASNAPHREDGPEAKCRVSYPTGARDQQPRSRWLTAQRCQWLYSKMFLLEVCRGNLLRPLETRVITLGSLFQLPHRRITATSLWALACVRPCPKRLAFISSSNLPTNPVRQITLFAAFYLFFLKGTRT